LNRIERLFGGYFMFLFGFFPANEDKKNEAGRPKSAEYPAWASNGDILNSETLLYLNV